MNYILFDDESMERLRPLTLSRPVCDLLIGMSTIKEKWEFHLREKTSVLTTSYLRNHYYCQPEENNCLINGSFLPKPEFIHEIQQLDEGAKLMHKGKILAVKLNRIEVEKLINFPEPAQFVDYEQVLKKKDLRISQSAFLPEFILHPWDIFAKNGKLITAEFQDRVKGRKSIALPDHCIKIGADVFIEEGAKVKASTFNAENGPIFISKNAEVMEGSNIRGPFFIGEDSTLKMGAKIYGDTSIGKNCKVGGEVTNSVIFDFSNKGHDGFIGNSVIGSWCNLGADTNSSNLKNNYGEIKIWDYASKEYQNSGLQFCGLIMGDHSKTGINTMLNTGTVIGFCSNVFGAGFPPKFIPSFCWGGAQELEEYEIERAKEASARMMSRRNIHFTENESAVFHAIFELSRENRSSSIK